MSPELWLSHTTLWPPPREPVWLLHHVPSWDADVPSKLSKRMLRRSTACSNWGCKSNSRTTWTRTQLPERICCVTPTELGTAGWSPEQLEGPPCREGSWSPSPRPAGGGSLLTQVLLPHSGMLVLGPRQCGNRIRAARQRLSTPAKECERPRRWEGRAARAGALPPGHPCWLQWDLTVPISNPGKGKSLQFSLKSGLGANHSIEAKWLNAQLGFSVTSDFPSHPKKKKI